MASVDTSVFEVSVGEAGKAEPHILFGLDIELGGTAESEGRAHLNSLLGHDPELFTPYVLLQTESSTHAVEMAEILNEAYTTAKSAPPNPNQNTLAFLLHSVTNTDGYIVTPVISNRAENVVITLTLQSALREQIDGVAEMVRAQAGPLLENKSFLSFSLDIGNTFNCTLNTKEALLDLFSSIHAKLEFSLFSNMSDIVNQLVGALGLPPPVRAAISAATLFKSAECRVHFASPELLPESIKSLIPTPDGNFGPPGEADKALVQLFSSHSSGKLTAFLLAPTSFVKLTMGLPGFTKFLAKSR